MAFYVIADIADMEIPEPNADTTYKVATYLDVLPVFTTRKLLREFVSARHAAQDPIWPMALEVDPIELATMAEQFEAADGLRSLVFDPEIGPAGNWILRRDPISVSSYRRYIVELSRTTKRLFAEGRVKYRDECSSPEELDEMAAAWIIMQEEKVNADVWALTEEWEIEDGK